MIPLNLSIEFDDTTRAWNDWKHGTDISNPFVHERYTLSLTECTNMYHVYNTSDHLFTSFDIPDLVRNAPESSKSCHVCRKARDQLYPCRICGKAYHERCVQDMGERQSSQWIKNAHQLIGWSCPLCDDLRVLLPAEELTETKEWIKSLGTQTHLNLHTYLNTRLKSQSAGHFSQFLNRMNPILQTFLHTIPELISNRLSPSDLFTLDLSLKIIRVPAEQLMHLLSPWELFRLSELFLSFSSLDHQYVSHQKFDQIFHRYLQRTMPELNFTDEQLHFQALTDTFFGRSMHFNRTWSQFLLDATIPTLFARINHRNSNDFTTRVLSTNRSISSSPDHNHDDGQSTFFLIQNILRKLTQTIDEPIDFPQKKTPR